MVMNVPAWNATGIYHILFVMSTSMLQSASCNWIGPK